MQAIYSLPIFNSLSSSFMTTGSESVVVSSIKFDRKSRIRKMTWNATNITQSHSEVHFEHLQTTLRSHLTR